MQKSAFSSVVASALAGLVLATSAHGADAKAKKGDAKTDWYCQNNNCAGKSACSGHGNDNCKGHNSCKGKGWLKAKTQDECKKAGGVWAKDAAGK